MKAEAVDVTLLPTLMQRRNPQLWMASTANAKASGLMLGRRAAALAQLDRSRPAAVDRMVGATGL